MGRKIFRRIKEDLKKKVRGAKGIIFFLDYDGTLTPIRKKPNLARLKKSTKNLLRKIEKHPRFQVFIISGRILKDVKNRVGVKSLSYIGNHGIELEERGLKYTNPVARRLRPAIQKSYRILKNKLRVKGLILENKIYTLSVHYRMVPKTEIPNLRKVFNGAVKELKKNREIKITHGKKVFEIRPNIICDKGTIVKWILKRKNMKKYLPICIGDDTTDEDAFRAIGKKGITILVSRRPKKTFAQYRLDSPKEVVKLLKWFLTLRNTHNAGRKTSYELVD